MPPRSGSKSNQKKKNASQSVFDLSLEKKRALLLMSVIAFMIILFGVWIININSFMKFKPAVASTATNMGLDEWQAKVNATMSGLGQTLGQVAGKIDESKQSAVVARRLADLADSLQAKYGTSSPTSTLANLATSTTATASINWDGTEIAPISETATSAILQAADAKVAAKSLADDQIKKEIEALNNKLKIQKSNLH